MTDFAHEHVIIVNSGLRDERVVLTGDDEHFRTREAAQASAGRLNAAHDLGLVVYTAEDVAAMHRHLNNLGSDARPSQWSA